jgi:hypothetical protein
MLQHLSGLLSVQTTFVSPVFKPPNVFALVIDKFVHVVVIM